MSDPKDPPPPGDSISSEDAEVLCKLNATCARISQRVDRDPFTLADPYKGDGWEPEVKRHLSAYTPGRIFRPEEAHWQYATFVFRDAEKDSDYSCFDRFTELDERLYQQKRQGEQNTPTTQDVPTQKSAPARKKISLADYKNKKDGAPPSAKSIDSANPSPRHDPAPPSRKRPLDVTSQPPEAGSSPAPPLQDQPPKRQKTTTTSSPSLKPSPFLRAASGQKPKATPNNVAESRPSNAKLEALVSQEKAAAKTNEDSNGSLSSKKSEKLADPAPKKSASSTAKLGSDAKKEATPAKTMSDKPSAKAKASQEATAAKPATKKSSRPSAETENTPGSSRHGLPPLLSPTGLPEPPHGLPPMLSPTLPPELEAQLASAELAKSKQAEHDDQSSVSDRMPPPAARRPSPPARPITSAEHQRRRSLHQDGDLQRGIAVPTKKKKARDVPEPINPPRANTTSTSVKKTLPDGLHRIRLGKRLVNEVYVSKGKVIKRRPDSLAAVKQSSPQTPKKTRTDETPTSSETKRTKTSKLPEADRKPRSSLNPETPRTLVNGHVRDEQLTPQGDGDTPGSSKAHGGRAWSDEHKHWFGQGRDLKREVTKELQAIETELPPGQGKTLPPTERLARTAIKSVECLLCFLLAFSVQEIMEKSRRGRALDLQVAKNTWLTLDGIFRMFGRVTRPFPHLDGLRFYIGCIIGERIVKCFSTSTLPTIPNPDGSQSQSSPATLATIPIDVQKLQEAFRAKYEYAREARSLLSPETLRTQYTDSWRAQSQGPPPTERESMPHTPGKWPVDFYLPLSGDTTPIQAVAFAQKFLLEWQRKNKEFGSAKLSFRLSPEPPTPDGRD